MSDVLLSRQQTDSLRGLAALTIAVFHLLIAWNCPRVVNLPGSVSVAIFLFLSGYGINESYKKTGLTDYWRKKFRRVVIPFWLFVTVLIPFQSSFGWKDYLMQVAFIDSPFWFIPYLMWCYALYWVVQRFFASHFVIVYVVVALVGLHLLHQMAAEQSFSFFCGVMASRHIERLRSLKTKQLLWIALTALGVGLAFLLLKEISQIHAYKGTVFYNYILLFIKLPLAIFVILLPSLWPLITRSRLLHICGLASLEIYLVHLAVVHQVPMQWLHVLCFVLFTAVFSYLFYQINHKIIARII